VKLLLDLGNSCLKWAVSLDGRITQHGRLEFPGSKPLEAMAFFSRMSAAPDEIRLASVAGPDRSQALAEALRAHFAVPLLQARSPGAGAGIRNGYRDPAQLGVDRWLALCAAYGPHPGAPACVVDAGTATTLDVVLADGMHRGGLILPGPDLMAASLRRGTGDLDRLARQAPAAGQVAGKAPDNGWFGRDTAAAIRLGAVRATASLVDACMAALAREVPDRPRLVLTGGNAPTLLALLESPAEHRPALVLEGLAMEPACFASSA
jgi:type III pantothenate kinase